MKLSENSRRGIHEAQIKSLIQENMRLGSVVIGEDFPHFVNISIRVGVDPKMPALYQK